MLAFDFPAAVNVERAFERVWSNAWRRANDADARHFRQQPAVAAWRVDLPKAMHAHPAVDHVFVVLERSFPWSEPRVLAPQAVAKNVPPWPHVEPGGLLCLKTTPYDAPPGDRVTTTLQDALELLRLDVRAHAQEFRSEFLSYWSQLQTAQSLTAVALVALDGISRDIYYWRTTSDLLVFADDAELLARWATNLEGKAPGAFPSTRFVWLGDAPLPAAFPHIGKDVFELAGGGHLDRHLQQGVSLPVLLGIVAGDHRLLAGVELRGSSAEFLARGFRKSSHLPRQQLPQYFHALPIGRFPVERADAAWVHGRDNSADLPALRRKTACLVGCGAIGGFLARALMQSGVGSFVLIDPDDLTAANTSRHLLGMPARGRRKALALAEKLRSDFPDAVGVRPIARSFEAIDSTDLAELGPIDLLISAGASTAGDAAIDRWRETTDRAPPWVCCWTEEFALAGHALAIFGTDRLSPALDGCGHFRYRLTSGWPNGLATLREPGCGNTFQPYSVVDLHGTVSMAARLSLDVLLARVTQSCSRVWLGDLALARKLGCRLDPRFDASYAERPGSWPPHRNAPPT